MTEDSEIVCRIINGQKNQNDSISINSNFLCPSKKISTTFVVYNNLISWQGKANLCNQLCVITIGIPGETMFHCTDQNPCNYWK